MPSRPLTDGRHGNSARLQNTEGFMSKMMVTTAVLRAASGDMFFQKESQTIDVKRFGHLIQKEKRV